MENNRPTNTSSSNTQEGSRPYSGGGRDNNRDNRSNSRPPRRGGDGKRRFFRKKVCFICSKKIGEIDYKNIDLLRRFVTDRGKILPRRITGTCAKHQRIIACEVKRARTVALLPYEDK